MISYAGTMMQYRKIIYEKIWHNYNQPQCCKRGRPTLEHQENLDEINTLRQYHMLRKRDSPQVKLDKTSSKKLGTHHFSALRWWYPVASKFARQLWTWRVDKTPESLLCLECFFRRHPVGHPVVWKRVRIFYSLHRSIFHYNWI